MKSGHKSLFNKYWCLLKQKFTSANTVSFALLPISRFVLHLCICRFILFRQSKLSWGWGVIVAFLDVLFIFPLAETQYISERRVPCMIFQSVWCFCFLSDMTKTFFCYLLFIHLTRETCPLLNLSPEGSKIRLNDRTACLELVFKDTAVTGRV